MVAQLKERPLFRLKENCLFHSTESIRLLPDSALLLTTPNIEVSGCLYQTKKHITHIVYQSFSRVTPPNYIALGLCPSVSEV